MRRIFIVIISIITWITSYSQHLPPFQSLRYTEDYSSLKEDTSSNWYKKMKFSPLSKNKNTYISYGGDARFQYFYTKNEAWGDAAQDNDGYILARFLAHADLHIGKSFRTFVELQSSLSGSRIDASPVDQNQLDLHQAFIDIKGKLTPSASFTFRLGRQEFLYGSQRLVTVREGPNSRRSFDAVRSTLAAENFTADLFYSHPVVAKKNRFDDGFNKDTKFWGVYMVRNNLSLLKNADLYYLGLWRRHAAYDDGEGEELRHSIGTRIWSKERDWKFDIEGLFQFGKFGDKNIAAWTASMHTSYTFSSAILRPEIGLKTELISGDKHYDDNDGLQTFNPLFPRGAYFGLAALIGPANLVDVHPSISLSLTKNLDFSFDYDVFWRYSQNDGLYGINGLLTYSGKNITTKDIGRQLAFYLTYTANKFFEVTTEFTWFDAGDYLKAAGTGKDILFTGVTFQYKF